MQPVCDRAAVGVAGRLSAQVSVMDRSLGAAHKGHHFCKNFTKYSVPSLSLDWNMIFNMLHKCWWLFLVWNLRLLKIEEEKVEFVVCYHSLYVLPDVGLSHFPLRGEFRACTHRNYELAYCHRVGDRYFALTSRYSIAILTTRFCLVLLIVNLSQIRVVSPPWDTLCDMLS